MASTSLALLLGLLAVSTPTSTTTSTSTSTSNTTSSSNPTSSGIAVRPVSDARQLAREAGHGHPAVLHFWATWCDACREEFPRIRKLLNALPARNIGVLLVSIDRPEKIEEVKRDLRRFGVSRLPAVVLDAPDPDPVAQAVGDPAWDGTLPSTFVFDAQGRLRKSFLGRTDPAALEAALRAVR
jgi:thiol-disulfide isomerase/thioredoxin